MSVNLKEMEKIVILKCFILGSMENNNYLLIDEGAKDKKEAVLIDCTEKSEDIENTLQEYGAELKYVLLTHGHFDHVLGVNSIKEKYDCKVLMHAADNDVLDSIEEFSKMFGMPLTDTPQIDEYINEGDIIKFGENEIKVIHTPGHTPGGVCYLINNDIFTGDTLFYEYIGRTDLPGGSSKKLKTNIINKLFTLDENITVYPGHGPSSTIGYEKENNKCI